ncbi:MAG: hypothetical protein KC613_05580 [Myxococcales bacterium]|nr:hypothetical protein [Myxococcales bacterium]MCB9526371.1 hypothetical protein [Myxococcales bacterium]
MMRALLTAATALALATPALADDKTLCVYDPSGANGDIFNLTKDYRTEAIAWGVTFELKPYTDEKTASEDFKAKKCDAVLMTGTRGRDFLKFAGTLEAMGALPEYNGLKTVVQKLGSPKAAGLMRSGDYETAAIFPGGAVYLMVRDKAVDTVPELAGRKLATLDFDEAAKIMVKIVGAALVPADVSSFASMFNNGSVEAAYAPATAYKALELYKGIGDAGGVIRYPLAQMTLQLMIRHAEFPADFGTKSRAFAAKNFGKFLSVVQKADKSVPAKHWIDIPAEDKAKYDQMFQDVRVRLRDQEKVYDGRALKLMRKVRCQADAARAECAQQRE